MMEGIWRFIKLAIDPKSAQNLESDAKQALDKGTDPKTPKKNLSAVEKGMQAIRRAAISLGAAIAAAFTVRAIGRFLTSSLQAGNELRRSRDLLRQVVENEGHAWADVAYQIDNVTQALWRTHRLTEGDINPILQQLIAITGDYENSLRAVGLAADVAAGLQIDHASAARLVGRVLQGDLAALRRYRIEVAAGADAVQVLMDRFGGMAAAAVTPTQQLSLAWNDFKEALGEALIQAGDGDSLMDALTKNVKDLTQFVIENADTWQEWGKTILQATREAAVSTAQWWRETSDRITQYRISLLETQITMNSFYARFHPMRDVRDQMRELINDMTADLERLRRSLDRTADGLDPVKWYLGARGDRPSIDPLPPPTIRAPAGEPGEARRGIPGMPTMGLLGVGRSELDARRQAQIGAEMAAEVSAMLAPGQALEAKRQKEAEERLEKFRDRVLELTPLANNVSRAFEDMFEGIAVGFAGTDSLLKGLAQGFEGFGRSIVASMAEGQAEFQMAEGTKALASGTWPPNPAALKAAGLHFAAAGMYRAISSFSRRGIPGSGSPASTATTRPSVMGQAQAPEINIYIDPLNPSNPAWQSNLAQTLRGVTQRYGSTNVNVRPRTA